MAVRRYKELETNQKFCHRTFHKVIDRSQILLNNCITSQRKQIHKDCVAFIILENTCCLKRFCEIYVHIQMEVTLKIEESSTRAKSGTKFRSCKAYSPPSPPIFFYMSNIDYEENERKDQAGADPTWQDQWLDLTSPNPVSNLRCLTCILPASTTVDTFLTLLINFILHRYTIPHPPALLGCLPFGDIMPQCVEAIK